MISLHRPAHLARLLIFALLVPGLSGCSLGPLGASRRPDQVLAIAAVFPNGGVDAPVGRALRRGVDLAVRQHARLAHGYRLTVVHVNEMTLSGRRVMAVLAANRHVLAIVGPLESESAAMMLPVIERRHIATISPGATLPGLTQASAAKQEGLSFAALHPSGTPATFFRIPQTDNAAGRAAADLAVAPAPGLAAHTVFVADDGSASGRALAGAFAGELVAKGGSLAGHATIVSDNPLSTQSAVSAIIEADPNLVFYAGGTATGAQLRRTLSLTGAPQLRILTAGSIADNPGWTRAVGLASASAYTTAVLPAHDLSTRPTAKRFEAAYHRTFPHRILLPQSALAYDAAMDEIRAMQALIKAGKKVTRSSVLSAVRSASYRGVTGTFAFDQKGNDLYRLGFSLYTCDLKGVWHYQRALQ